MTAWQELLVDLVVIAVFVAGIAQFRTPSGARRGNLTAALAFAAALALVVLRARIGSPWIVVPAFAVGGVAGWLVSARITMTRIPALVALQNGAGGGASLLVSLVELARMGVSPSAIDAGFAVAGALVGGVALSGSLVAAGKLEGRLGSRPRVLPAHNAVLLALLAAAVALGAVAITLQGPVRAVALVGVALAVSGLGVALAVRVGGADMPVMISLLNAFSGLAAGFLGVSLGNQMLIAAGAMVGSSGTVLTLVMARAMNRSIYAILTGHQLAEVPAAPATASTDDGTVVTGASTAPAPDEGAPVPESPVGTPLERARDALAAAESVIIVPGYGMALAQAQDEVAALASSLEAGGKLVRFAVHPVAGRMPGHMHVLLAEAQVDYDKLFEMDAINDEFSATDVVLIVGACDVVNPAAITVEGTPISGMPILRAHEASTVIVCNLDDKPGYSGVPNPLYDDPRTVLLLGDAKETVASLQAGL